MQDDENIVSVWQALRETEKPIVMYGMGNGADHILSYFDRFGIESVCRKTVNRFGRYGNKAAVFQYFCGSLQIAAII